MLSMAPHRFLPCPSPMQPRTSLRTRRDAFPRAESVRVQETMKEMAAFLEQDLPHLFDEQGIDRRRYEERVEFRDPLTSYDTLSGYLFNIQMLRFLFGPQFFLHKVKQTGPNELTTRWTMRMTFRLLPWKPELLFTGVSVMGVNLETRKFVSHVDLWDSIDNNEYFSFEGAKDVLKQLRHIYKTPDLETPQYMVVKRMRSYEVRLYEPFLIVESRTEGVSTSKGFNSVTGYIFGKNQTGEKIKMTTPVFNERGEDSDKIQVVLPSKYELSELPAPSSEDVGIRRVDQMYAAAVKFSGEVSDVLVKEKEQSLREAVTRDGLKASQGFLLARYNDPGRTPSFLRRNEVLIRLEDFELDV